MKTLNFSSLLPSFILLLSSISLTFAAPPPTPTCKQLTPRREWRTLSKEQKTEWISSIKCLGSIRHHRLSYTAQGTFLKGSPSLYDDFAYAHSAMDKSAHFNPYFLPWHRWFIYIFDLRLRETCGYKGPTPYWDWTQDAADLKAAPVFDPSPTAGLGETGSCSPEEDCVITSGALLPPDFVLLFPIPHQLRRNLSYNTWADLGGGLHNTSLSLENIEKNVKGNVGDFFKFQRVMTRIHSHIHNFVGGDLAGECPAPIQEDECDSLGGYTPNDPIFWLHHGQLDRLWSEWQKASPKNYNNFAGVPLGAKNLTNSSYWPNATVDHILEFDRVAAGVPVSMTFNHEQPPFCYTYE
ncbi:tyrosinase [Pluteus cervinus]|uniref:Tyrosinase n=1 Tax=Pluteus cervinus TaxID=181527 RepID=A0ACD3BBC7_9AGAR|nr:tyrosinase [Pluteus cervinus]